VTVPITAFWEMEEPAGNSRADSYASYDLSEATNNVGRAAGLFGYGADFDLGSNQCLYHDDAALRTDDFTLAMWMTWGAVAGSNQWFAGRRNLIPAAYTWDAYRVTSGVISYRMQANATTYTATSTSTIPTDGTKTLVVIRSDESGTLGTAHKMYLDVLFGATHDAVSTVYHVNGPDSTVAPLCLGNIRNGAAGYASGANAVIDHAAFDTSPWTAADIAWYFNGGAGRAWPWVVRQSPIAPPVAQPIACAV